MKLLFYVAQAASTANKPGEVQNILRLNLPPKTDAVDDSNPGAFTDDARKHGLVEINGLTDELMAGLKGGQRVIVTIDPVK